MNQPIDETQPFPALTESPTSSQGSEFIDSAELLCIDLEVLQTFRDILGETAEEFLTNLINVYFEDTPNLLQAIRTAIAQSDPAAMRNAAHTLKSSSKSLGAMKLSKFCQAIEDLGKSQTITGALELLTHLEREYTKVKVALQLEHQGD